MFRVARKFQDLWYTRARLMPVGAGWTRRMLVVTASLSGHKEADANTPGLAPASLPVWLVPLLLRLRLRQAVALVLYIDGDLGQRLGVLAAMVRTEKQLS